MFYDFDQRVNRKTTNDLKWNRQAVEHNLHTSIPESFIPMWIADTDFACPPHLVEALRRRVNQQIFGYCIPGAPFYRAVCWWEQTRFQWTIRPEWITALPSVVSGINIAIRAFTNEGEGVIIQPPVYEPFSQIITRTGRKVVNNPLQEINGRYEMCFELMEQQASDPNNRMMILCSPHNPVGRVWTQDELHRLADICVAHNVLLVSDEIHSDIIYEGHVHRPIISLNEAYANHFIHLTAPGKTFNVPGLKMSVAIIPKAELKQRFEETQLSLSLDIRNTFGVEGVEAAYSPESIPWLEEELHYLQENVDFVEAYLPAKLPGIKMNRPEGSFLCWLDCSALGLTDEELMERVNLKAGVICVPGTWFGPGGEHHLRLNVGCPRDILTQALERLVMALF